MTTPLPSSRQAAQQRTDQIHAFTRELAQLEADAVLALPEAQRARLAAHHQALLADYARLFDVDHDSQARRLSLGMRISSLFGALALAASVFFLFYQFWGHFSETVQVAILATASLATLGITAWLRNHDASGYFARLAALLAFACFVLNVVMLGQIFNITPSPQAFFVWAALALLLAYVCDLRLLLVAGLVCATCFVTAWINVWSGLPWSAFDTRPEHFFPIAPLLFCLPQWLRHRQRENFMPVYHVCALVVLLLAILVLSKNGDHSYLGWNTKIVEGAYQLSGFALSAAAIWLGLRRQWAETVNTGVVFFLIFLAFKFYDWWWELLPKWAFFLLVGLIALACLLALKRLRYGNIPQGET